MSAGADYMLGDDVSNDAVIVAVAHAYGIPAARVALLPQGELHDWPDADVVLNTTSIPGDYPVLLTTWDSDERPPEAIAASLAATLGVTILVSGESFDPTDMELVLPDASVHRIWVAQDGDEGFRNTPGMREFIDAASTQTSQTHVRAA
ncbi:MAG: hypothetical protein QM753_18325 [Thermomicrobiales bacterium]